MSTIKLPELPVSPESVYFEGDGDSTGELVPMYSGIQMRAYAEEAVHQALAVQVPVAWIALVDGKPVDRPSRDRWLMERSAGSWANGKLCGLAIIPEPDKEPPC